MLKVNKNQFKYILWYNFNFGRFNFGRYMLRDEYSLKYSNMREN